VYRLLCPVAVLRLCQTKLTSVDLTVDPWVRAQYLTAKQLYRIWISAAELADAEPGLRYEPFPPDSPACGGVVDPRQHLSVAQVELLIEALQVRDDKGPIRCRSFGEFIIWRESLDSTDDQTAPLRDAVATAMALFEDFHPSTRPVLWRALLAEARCSKLLIRAFEAHAAHGSGDGSAQSAGDLLFTDKERAELDWTQPEAPVGQREHLADSFRAVYTYLKDLLGRYGLYESRTVDSIGQGRWP